jgi:opacity protein-like surface antigen
VAEARSSGAGINDPNSPKEEILMLRRLCLLAGLILVASISAHAQDKVELFGGYSFMRVDNSPSFNTNGWELSGNYKFADWLGGVADFDGHYASPGGLSTSLHTYLFGPQVSWPARVSPFAHVLLGGAHASAGGESDTSFAMAIGAGIDTRVLPGIYWRVIQGDYLRTRFFGQTQNNGRLSTGIVFKF